MILINLTLKIDLQERENLLQEIEEKNLEVDKLRRGLINLEIIE
jgi:hypothetical protein